MARASFAFVDVETTGLDLERDRVIELCIDVVQGGELKDRIDVLVNPGERLGGAQHVHGITPDLLVGARAFGSHVDRVMQLLAGSILVAHASSWDVGFLRAEAGRLNRELAVDHHLDTVALARRAFSFPSNRLGALAQSLGITREVEHRAGADVAAMRAVFDHIVRELAPGTPRDLWDWQRGAGRAREEVLVACEGAVGHPPVALRYRPSGRPQELMTFQITAVRRDLDPPRVIGYLLPGRGRLELRADRIIAVALPDDAKVDLASGEL